MIWGRRLRSLYPRQEGVTNRTILGRGTAFRSLFIILSDILCLKGPITTILMLQRNQTNNLEDQRTWIKYYKRNNQSVLEWSPLILSRNRSDESFHAKVPSHEALLAAWAGQHRFLFTAGFADLVALKTDVEITITIRGSTSQFFPQNFCQNSEYF